jgi:hypothetical protein
MMLLVSVCIRADRTLLRELRAHGLIRCVAASSGLLAIVSFFVRIFPKEPFCDKLVHGSPIYVLIFALSGSAYSS